MVDMAQPALFLGELRLLAAMPATGTGDGALRAIAEAGLTLVLVSNLAAAGRAKEWELRRAVKASQVDLGGIYRCPHARSVECFCRKPQPGLILRAAYELNLDLRRSWMVGDSEEDVEAGRRARIATVLIRRQRPGMEWIAGAAPQADYVAQDLREAVRMVRAATSHWPLPRTA